MRENVTNKVIIITFLVCASVERQSYVATVRIQRVVDYRLPVMRERNDIARKMARALGDARNLVIGRILP